MQVTSFHAPSAMPPVPAEAVDHPTLSAALRQSFHAGDAWRAVSVSDRLLEGFSPTAQDLAMRGEALRHVRAPWRAAVELLASRYMSALEGKPEASWVAEGLAVLHAELSVVARPMPDDVLDVIDARSGVPGVGRPVIEALSALPHDQAHALSARTALLALVEGDASEAREAATAALALRPDDMTTFVVHAMASADQEDGLDHLEEAWRRMVFGPVDATDRQLDRLGRRLGAVSQQALVTRRLEALADRGFHEERLAVAEEALSTMPWSLSIGMQRGNAYRALGRFMEAVRAFDAVVHTAVEEGIADDPRVLRTRYLRAAAKAEGGDRNGALRELGKVIEANSDFIEDALTDEAFVSLRDNRQFQVLCEGTLGALAAGSRAGFRMAV
ncbi:MAG: hypothetical protein AB8I08_31460 [Sandaracinaceae bacterium]